MSQYILKPLSEEDAKEICTWTYPEPYDVYNFSDWETCATNDWDLTIENIRERDFVRVERDGHMIAFGRMSIMDDAVNIGLGLKPVICGCGYGNEIVETLVQESKRRFPNRDICLTVRVFNVRAIQCYKKVGFSIVSTFTKDMAGVPVDFYLMTFSPQP